MAVSPCIGGIHPVLTMAEILVAGSLWMLNRQGHSFGPGYRLGSWLSRPGLEKSQECDTSFAGHWWDLVLSAGSQSSRTRHWRRSRSSVQWVGHAGDPTR